MNQCVQIVNGAMIAVDCNTTKPEYPPTTFGDVYGTIFLIVLFTGITFAIVNFICGSYQCAKAFVNDEELHLKICVRSIDDSYPDKAGTVFGFQVLTFLLICLMSVAIAMIWIVAIPAMIIMTILYFQREYKRMEKKAKNNV